MMVAEECHAGKMAVELAEADPVSLGRAGLHASGIQHTLAVGGRLKDFRRIATRYDKLVTNFQAAVYLTAAVCYWS